MTVDEKISHAQRKKVMGVKLIKEEKNYKKALKVFETINGFFDFGTFYDEDKLLIYDVIFYCHYLNKLNSIKLF